MTLWTILLNVLQLLTVQVEIEIWFIFGLPEWKLKHAQWRNHDMVCVAIVLEKRNKYFSIYLDTPLSFVFESERYGAHLLKL